MAEHIHKFLLSSFLLFHLSFPFINCLLLQDSKIIQQNRPRFLSYAPRYKDAAPANYKTFYYKTSVDKFGFSTNATFKMRYLLNDTFWAGKDSPIFFYAGNEGDVTGFANNTGAMFELGAKVGALLVFAEHRYYGESKVMENSNYKYLTAEFALADYAEFVSWLKTTGFDEAYNSPVVVFGGSYGGMLAAWMRIKYPNIIIGAWAGSAPVAWFEDLTCCNAYNCKVTQDFNEANENCPKNILRSWDVMNTFAQSESGREKLTKYFNLCAPLEKPDSVYALISEIVGAWSNVAMVNYPYPTEFLQPLPAWPVKVICEQLSSSNLTDDELMVQISAGVNIFYNYSGIYPCFNLSESDVGLDDNLWGFQACTEMIMPMCSRKGGSMFPEYSWDLEATKEGCEKQFGSQYSFRPDWMVTQFGARNVSQTSNIIFSNGKLDPWAAGGVSDNEANPTIYTILIEDAAHHLDLRSSNSADPDSVKEARAAEFMIVESWLKNYYKEMNRLHHTQRNVFY